MTCKEKNIMPKFCKIQSNQQPTEIFKYMQHSSEQIIELRDKVIFNFWSLVLTDHEKTLLSKGLNFTILHKDLNYVDYLLPFELSYSDINSLKISNFDKDCIKTKLRDLAFSSYNETSNFMENNLPKSQLVALKSLFRNKELIIQKFDKDNTVVLLNRKDYISKTKY